MATNKLLIPIALMLLLGIASATNVTNVTQPMPSLNLATAHYNSLGQAVAACAVGCTNRTEINTSVVYGSVPNAAAGSNLYFPYKTNTMYDIYNVSIAKDPSYACINLTSTLFSDSFCSPGTYHLPVSVINGRFGINGPTSISITAKLSSTLIGSQTVPYTARIQAGSSTLYFVGSQPSSSLSDTQTFTYSAGESLNITLNGGGNANYSAEDPTVTTPANIIYYLPITLVNTQNAAVGPNNVIEIGFTTGNVFIGYNAQAYQLYETPNLTNTDFFFPNGVVLNSWLEGNYFNQMAANAPATSETSTNSLSNSANVIWWVEWPWPSGFLTANTGGSPTNTIYMGFTYNGIYPTNNLMNGAQTGEAPQLVCSNTWLTNAGCPYGIWDNGNTVFPIFYSNFTTNSNNRWTTYASPQGTTITISNGLIIHATGGAQTDGMYSTSPTNGNQFTLQMLFTMNSVTGGGPGFLFGESVGTSFGTSQGSYYNSYYWEINGPSTLPSLEKTVSSTQTSLSSYTSCSIYVPSITSLYWDATLGHEKASDNPVGLSASAADSSFSSNTNLFAFFGVSGGAQGHSANVMYVKAVPIPPGNAMPLTIFGTITSASSYSAPTCSQPTATNTMVDIGQYETVSCTVTGGTANFIGNIITTNAGTTTNTLRVLSTSSTTMANTFYVGSNQLNSFTANFVGHDSNTMPTAFNSIPSAPITVNSALGAPTMSPSSVTIETGSSNTLIVSWTGGTPNFVVTLFTTSSTCSSGTSESQQTTGVTGQTTTFTVTPGSTTSYCAGVKDAATTAESANQVTASTVTVNPGPSITSVISSNRLVDQTQYQTITGTWTGGTAGFTVNFFVTNTVNGNIIANSLGAATSPAAFTFQIPQSNNALGGLQIAFNVIDSLNGKATTTNTFGANAFPVASGITPSTPFIDSGQAMTLTSHATPGTNPLTISWFTGSSCNSYTGSQGTTYTPSPSSTTAYTYNIVDSATTNAVTCSLENTVNVINALGTPSITPLNPTIDSGQQSITFSSVWAGGVTDFTATLYSSASSTCNTGSTAVQTISSIGGQAASFSSVSPSSTTYYCIFVTDSSNANAGAETTNSVNSKVTVSSALVAGGITPSAPSLDSSQTTTLTSHASGGTGTYTYSWYSVAGSSSPLCNAANVIPGVAATLSISPTTTNTYSYQVTDHAVPTNEVLCSAGDTVSVYSYPQTPTISATPAPVVTFDNYEYFSANMIGGSPPFTYNYIVVNTVSGTQVANYLVTNSFGSNTFAWYVLSQFIGNTVAANVMITDNSITPVTLNSIESQTVSVTGAAAAAPVLTGQYYNMPFNVPDTVSMTPNPSTDFGEFFFYPSGQPQPAYTANLVSGTGTIHYAFCSGSNYCPNIGYYTINAYDTDPASNIITANVFVPVYFTNTMATNTYYANNQMAFATSTFYPFEMIANQIFTNNIITYNLNYSILSTTNPTSFNAPNAKVTYTANTVLTGDIVANNIVINPGIMVTTAGYYMLATNMIFFTNAYINAGFCGTPGLGASAPGGNGGQGVNNPASFGASGGGGAAGQASGGIGGATQASGGTHNGGAGSTPSPPTVNNANALTWALNIFIYLGGASGGGGGGGSPTGSGANGGLGSCGGYIQAPSIYQGNMITSGQVGASASGNAGPGAGGGAGIYIIAFNSFYSGGTNTVTGGTTGTGGSGSGGTGGTGNVIPYRYTTPPLAIPSITPNVIVESNVPSYNYVLPPGSQSATYFFQTKEMQQNNGNVNVILNATVTVNMTDIYGGFTFNGLCSSILQYFPDCVIFPFGANVFTAPPQSWSITSDNTLNQYNNFTGSMNAVEQFSNANTLFYPTVVLNYGAPLSLSFTVNAINNPGINSIVQTPYQVYTQLGQPSSPYTRNFITSIVKDEQFFATQNAVTKVSFSSTFNNYTLYNTGSYSGNTFYEYMATSAYQNPNIMVYNTTWQTTNSGFYPALNNYCPFTVQNGSSEALPPFLVNPNGSEYAFNVKLPSGAAANGYYITMKTGSPVTQVQSFLMAVASNFQLPLENGQLYGFSLYNTQCQPVYNTGMTTWTSPIIINITGTSNSLGGTQLTLYKNVTTSCSTVPLPGNFETVTCSMQSLNGQKFNSTLSVVTGSILTQQTACSASNTLALANTLSCTVGNTNSNVYTWTYNIQDNWYHPLEGIFGTAAQAFGTWGLYFALLIMIVFITLYVSKNPIVTIIMAEVGFTVVELLNFTTVSPLVLGFSYLGGGLVVYLLNRAK